MGKRFPTAAQTPYFNMSAFAYPDSYTIGSLGSRVLQAPALLWMQCFATKSWKSVDERLKLSLRLDGHNLPWKRPESRRAQHHVQSEQHRRRGPGSPASSATFPTSAPRRPTCRCRSARSFRSHEPTRIDREYATGARDSARWRWRSACSPPRHSVRRR